MNKTILTLLFIGIILTLGCTSQRIDYEDDDSQVTVTVDSSTTEDLGDLSDLPDLTDEDLGDLGSLGMGSSIPTSPDVE